LGHLAAHEKATETGHLPHLEIDAGRRLADRKAHVGADVEGSDLDGADLALDGLDQRDHLLLFPRVRSEGARLAALALDAGDEGSELVRVAPRHAGRVALAREAARNRATRGIAGANH